MTRPFTLRAARPMVWMSEVADRRNPILSASRIAMRETSGRSRPSRSRLMPTRTSKAPSAQVPQDLHALDCLDLRMQVAHLQPQLPEVVGEVLRHPLGERGDQGPLALLHLRLDLRVEVLHLALRWPHLQDGVQEPRRADDLLGELARLGRLLLARGGGDEDDPVEERFELVVDQRTVVQRRGQAETVLHQGKLARPVPLVHSAHLGQGDVRLVDERQELLRKEVEENGGPLPFLPAAQVPGVVLDARAVPHLLQHLQVVLGARLDPLRLQELAFVAELLVALLTARRG